LLVPGDLMLRRIARCIRTRLGKICLTGGTPPPWSNGISELAGNCDLVYWAQ
jgi:hypothetical protein